jgi:hypothetical protein
MALKIEGLRDQRSTRSLFVSKRRLYVSADDEVVEANDPRAIRLLVGAGASIPNAVAEAYGLVSVTPEQVAGTSDAAARTTTDAEADARSERPADPPVAGELVADQKGDTRRYDDKSLKPETVAAPAESAQPSEPEPEAPSDEPGPPATPSSDGAPPDETWSAAAAEKLERLTRGELNAIALERGVEAPEELANKGAVIAAIEATEEQDEDAG